MTVSNSSMNGSTSAEPMHFDSLELQRVSFFVGKKEYCVKEASADVGALYKNANMRAAKFVDGKMVAIEGAANADLQLVSLSVDEVLPDGKYKNVPAAEVKKWPNKINKWILETVLKISNLRDEEETEESLLKEIELLEERLDKLREKEESDGGEDSEGSPGTEAGAGNSPSATTDSSV